MTLYLIIHPQDCSAALRLPLYVKAAIAHTLSHLLLRLFHRHILQKISKLTLENNGSLSQSNHLHNCTSRTGFSLYSLLQ